ncbi:MAG: HAD family hydrolase [Deltaproteobacteria bacterium]|nr:HAD family hydrolase [Deltaproteobacteria bacterium]
MARLAVHEEKTAVFLDRDGTINEDTGYISRPEDLVLIKGAPRAIKLLNDKGIQVIVISNQSGVGRGLFTGKDAEAVNHRLEEMLRGEGAYVDGIYYCPHHPEEGCVCRKPKPGLLRKAASIHKVKLAGSYVVGDKALDVGLARSVEAKGVLVMTGEGKMELNRLTGPPDFIAKDIMEAVLWIMEDLTSGKDTAGMR